MQNKIFWYSSIGAAALVLAGCGGTTTDPGDSGSGGGDPPPATTAPAFPENSGQAAKVEKAYPAAPWATKKLSVIANHKFIGFANASLVNDSLQAIELADFYNPHADDPSYMPESAEVDDRLFAPGSPYGAGTPKPKALTLIGSAVWCGPCNAEAKDVLPDLHAKYKPMGGEFLLLLTDGLTQGVPATPKSLFNWTKKYAVDFPATVEPGGGLSGVFTAYPTNIIINTRTMVIVEIVQGVPQDSFWSKFEKTIGTN